MVDLSHLVSLSSGLVHPRISVFTLCQCTLFARQTWQWCCQYAWSPMGWLKGALLVAIVGSCSAQLNTRFKSPHSSPFREWFISSHHAASSATKLPHTSVPVSEAFEEPIPATVSNEGADRQPEEHAKPASLDTEQYTAAADAVGSTSDAEDGDNAVLILASWHHLSSHHLPLLSDLLIVSQRPSIQPPRRSRRQLMLTLPNQMTSRAWQQVFCASRSKSIS